MDIPSWLSKWAVTGTWAQHLARGSKGGVDFAAPVGTPIYSPTAGTVDYRIASDGSSIARIKRADGTATEFLHGVPYPNGWATGPRQVAANERVATSDGRKGAKGANGSTGPHIHAHDVNAQGVRVFPFSTIAGGGGGGSTERNDEVSYSIVKNAQSATVWVVSLVSGRFAGIQNPYHLGLLQRVKVNNGGDPMLQGELDIVQGYLSLINPPAGLDVAALVSAIDKANDDETEAILAAVGKISLAAGATPAQIAAEVDKVLSGDFAAVPKAVLDLQAERLKS